MVKNKVEIGEVPFIIGGGAIGAIISAILSNFRVDIFPLVYFMILGGLIVGYLVAKFTKLSLPIKIIGWVLSIILLLMLSFVIYAIVLLSGTQL